MKVELKGDKELIVKLGHVRSLQAVKTVVSQNGHELNTRMQRHMETAYNKGYSSGETKDSVTEDYRDGGMTVEVGPNKDYDSYVEYGTRHMDAEPAIRPAFNEQAVIFQNDLEKLVK
ncbi:MAG: HK97-gp10 family putative phage morphogenesis protein [Chordicoccus sp.]|jgi:HK97 gp10 family phage protein